MPEESNDATRETLLTGLGLLAIFLVGGVVLASVWHRKAGFGEALARATVMPLVMGLGLWLSPISGGILVLSGCLVYWGMLRRSPGLSLSGFTVLGCYWLGLVYLSCGFTF